MKKIIASLCYGLFVLAGYGLVIGMFPGFVTFPLGVGYGLVAGLGFLGFWMDHIPSLSPLPFILGPMTGLGLALGLGYEPNREMCLGMATGMAFGFCIGVIYSPRCFSRIFLFLSRN